MAPSSHHGNFMSAVFLEVFIWIGTSAAEEEKVEAAASGKVT